MLAGFRNDSYDGAIAQVNLLKFRVRAHYLDTDPEHGADEPGSVAYGRTPTRFGSPQPPSGGVCLLFGEVERYFIGNGDWDAVRVN